MSFGVVRPGQFAFEQRPYREQDPPRSVAGLTDALGLTQSRASVWRYPAGSRGRRHREGAQEEVFVVLDGTATMMLGEPPQRELLPTGSLARVAPGTPLQIRNESDGELTLLIWGAPPDRGRAEILDDLE
jgi:mannose-6-phosphate isomerase-like protein (cupin superfamily)